MKSIYLGLTTLAEIMKFSCVGSLPLAREIDHRSFPNVKIVKKKFKYMIYRKNAVSEKLLL